MPGIWARMFFRRRAPVLPSVPAGERVYAVGDVHGRLDLLQELLADVEADDAARPPARTGLVFVGDLIDRGPDSAGVVRLVRELAGGDRFRVRLVKGNHEEMLLHAAGGSARAARLFMEVGGDATLRSYGIADEEADRGGYADLADLMRERLPLDDLDFLDRGEDMVRVGGYLFVHAGVRPGVPLDGQDPADLRWIRREFLESRRDHGAVVVHGHTPADAVEERPNRINIDTGAYATGRLTAIGLEGDRRWFLATGAEAALSRAA